MVTIRLARAGSKKRPFYHVHVAEKHNKRDGRYIEWAKTGSPEPAAATEATEATSEPTDSAESEAAA